ncbi:MAG: lytic transglycosylase domain-containing protein [Clostridia bacterium]
MKGFEKFKVCVYRLVLFALCVLVTAYFLVPYVFKNVLYVRQFEEFVTDASKRYDVDESLIFAVIKSESNFNVHAVSSMNAKGLMQLLDSTAGEMLYQLSDDSLSEDLFDPRNNIFIGTKYLSVLIKRYNSVPLAIAAYNGGIGNVDKWIADGTVSKEDADSLDSIPFAETRMYVKKVLRTYNIYEMLYK